MKAGPELNAKIATEVMGWSQFEVDGISYWQKLNRTDAAGPYLSTGYAVSLDCHPDMCPEFHSLWGHSGFFTPSAPDGIADAWLVVEKMKKLAGGYL